MEVDEAVNNITATTGTSKSTALALQASLPFKLPKTSHPSLLSTILGLLRKHEALVVEAVQSSAAVGVEAVISEVDVALSSV